MFIFKIDFANEQITDLIIHFSLFSEPTLGQPNAT